MTDQMGDSILVTIKKMLGLEDDYTPFDTDVLVHINAALMSLTQLGIGPREGFTITDYSQTWSDFITNEVKLGAVKTYIYLKVKMVFDPPTNSYLMDAMKQQAEEIGWRLNVQAESVEKFNFMHEDSLKRGGSPANISDLDEPEEEQEETIPGGTSSASPILTGSILDFGSGTITGGGN